ncbi:MAG: helix-turn-helix domain-containing protein [bacterium]
MRINLLRRGLLRVTRAGDNFYNRPLPDITAFLMDVDKAEVEPHAGAFSLKTVLRGRERYEFGRRSVEVKPGETLLVNAEETYASEIAGPCRSLSVFYRRKDVACAVRALTASVRELLDSPHEDGRPPEVAQVALRSGAETERALGVLARLLETPDTERAEDAARLALAAALRQSLRLAPPAALGHIVRRSTRDELLARVLRARSAILDRQGRNCTLDELAGIACLSKYHFLRVFSEAFGETPLAMARRVRLEAAARALGRGEPLPHAARRAGFRDTAAFRRALRHVAG